MSYLDRINDCKKFKKSNYIPFFYNNTQIGQIHLKILKHLHQFYKILSINSERINLKAPLDTFKGRTSTMAQITLVLKNNKLIKGWRNEACPVKTSFTSPTLFEIERAAAPLFGIKGYGVHLNGYIKKNNQIYLWVGKRSLLKQNGPGKLDQIVAGGQPTQLTIKENLIKECAEEANISRALVASAKSVGSISYLTERKEGLRDDEIFCFDIKLPNDFKPINTDGEVDGFFLWPLEKISQIIKRTENFKFNSALVVVDFLIRHGFISSNQKNYNNIVIGLNRKNTLIKGF